MTSLKDINFGINQYCGPAVLSALTGESTDRCAAVISAVSGKKEIKAVQRAHLKEALKRLRFEVNIETNLIGGSTLYGKLFNMHNRNGMYVIFVSHHVIAVEVTTDTIFICDNHSKTPLDIKQSARLSQQVEEIWRVVAGEPLRFISSSIEIIRDDNIIYISKYIKYENPDDDIRTTIGTIRYTNDGEYLQIVRAFQEVQ